MRLCVLDFETYWDVGHTLSKLNPIDYVMHPFTEIISVAAKFDDGETQCIFGEARIKDVFSRIDWSDTLVVGHNMSGFDAMILAWRLGVKPKMWGCTLAMARPFFQVTVGGSLKKVAAALGVGEKGDLEATNTKGKRYADFTPEEIEAMEVYNKLDVKLCYGIFNKLAPHTSKMEMQLIDRTIRMLVEPSFEVDVALLERTLEEEQQRKKVILRDLAGKLDEIGFLNGEVADEEAAEQEAKSVLASAAKFSKLLQSLDVDVPLKPSPSNPEKSVPALAKTDEAFIALQDHENPVVAAAARARLGVKSTLLESRIERLLEMSAAVGGKLPVPLNYHAAVTGRWGGCLVADTEVLVYNRPHGLETKRIVDVLLDDLVWDGEAFVPHDGVSFSGFSEVIEHDGVTGTADHKVFVGEGEAIRLSDARARRMPIQAGRSPQDSDVDAARIYLHNYKEFHRL